MLLRALILAVALAAPAPAAPRVGQDGKDVIWIPTPEALVERMLTMAQVTANDRVVDLGSGDGRLVIVAAKKFGARARGIEYDAELVALARVHAQQAGLSREQAQLDQGDIFKAEFGSATVVTLYLLPALNRRLRPILLAMRPGTRVVSHQFGMEDWRPDETSYVEQRAAHLWIVPARVGGGWSLTLPDGSTVELDLEQRFQEIEGRVQLGAVKAGLRAASLRGDVIRFSYVDASGTLLVFAGRVVGTKMIGNVQTPDGERRWQAIPRPFTDSPP